MKPLSIFTTIFLFSSLMPAFAYPSNDTSWKWDTKNMKMSDIRFTPDFMTLSVPAEDPKGNKFELQIQCGNNPNSLYKRLALRSRVETMAQDAEMVRELCTHALEMRDIVIRQLLATETCSHINFRYGIKSIPVELYGDLAKRKDRNRNGFACDL